MLITTSCGKFEIELYSTDNPATVAEFESLVDQGYFNDCSVSKSENLLVFDTRTVTFDCATVDSLKLTGAGILAFFDQKLVISLSPLPDTRASIIGRVSKGLATVEALRDAGGVVFTIEAEQEGVI